MKFVVKLGGAALEKPEVLATARKHRGPGARRPQGRAGPRRRRAADQALAQMGKQSEFVAGLRVTDAETRDAALMVLGGRVNKSLVAALTHTASPQSGLTGGDGHVFRARRRRPSTTSASSARSPRPTPSGSTLSGRWAPSGHQLYRARLRRRVLQHQRRRDGRGLRHCTKADALVFLTDVPGVKGADGAVMRWLSLAQVPALEKAAVVSGGMLPKLNACKEALTHGVKRVRILPAEVRGVLPDFPAPASMMERRSWSHEQTTLESSCRPPNPS